MPGEWEPHKCVWLCRPHNAETWPGCLDQAIAQFEYLLNALQARVAVANLDVIGVPTDDAWVRDYGPIFVVDNQSPSALQDVGHANLACHDFRFNGWGGKYGPHERDDLVTHRIARHLEIPCFDHSLI
ncbi:MAG: agmatine deiminase family protein, partial [Pirellulaceae bacterium]|nr:agmatine deiminase family protein [Pirellulaceae bacterium]